MPNQHDVECMSQALRLAKRGIYTTRPNPNVGCVITNTEGEIVGQGFHRKAGEAHAEINALNQAGTKAKGGYAYVTLEPCCHQGRTGPCVQALIDAGVSKVFSAMRDPNPLVSGKGLQKLQQHGIRIEENLLEDQAYSLNRGFIKRMTTGLPWVAVKIATSADGRTALNNGESKWISSEYSRLDVQKLRARFDAIMTGIGTVVSDNPSLNVRINKTELGIDQEPIQPVRIVIDPKLKMSRDAKMLSLSGRTVIFAGDDIDDKQFHNIKNCEVIKLSASEGRFDLHDVLTHIAKLEVNSVLVEAGSSLLGSLLNDKLADELIHYIAPTLMGNTSSGMFDINNVTTMDACISLEHQDVRQFGNDMRITSLIKYN